MTTNSNLASRLLSARIVSTAYTPYLLQGPIKALQYGRAIAAIAVVMYHSVQVTQAFSTPMPSWLVSIGSRGYLGVDFFFVLSGFIITYAHMRDERDLSAAIKYSEKRLMRIYVPYLPISIGIIAMYLAMPTLSMAHRDWGLFTSLSLFPTERPPALAVAWTLVHEMTFYSLFLVSYFSRRFSLVICGWILGILFALLVGWVPSIAAIRVLLSPINLEFIAGMGAALTIHRAPASWWPAWMSFGLCGVIAFFFLGGDENLRVWFGLSLVPLVVGAVLIERIGRIPNLWLGLALGDASYAIYLVHDPLASIAARAVTSFHRWPITLVTCLAAGILGGLAYHLAAERPAIARARSMLSFGRSGRG
jgi:exopolysaccharide production protein ExoZ